MAEPTKAEKERKQEAEKTFIAEEKQRNEKREEPQIDMERLMRQITKRLWEEREGCGRRLR